MTAETEVRHDVVHKYGFGIEMTVEALAEMVAQRFPYWLDQGFAADLYPSVSIDHEYGTIRLDFVQHREPANNEVFVRRIGEGAPIPRSIRIVRGRLLRIDGTPRCGGTHSEITKDDPYQQCVRRFGHDGDHAAGPQID